MKKILSFLWAALISVFAFAGTQTTVYYTVPAATVGSYTVRLNVNFKGDGEDWHWYVMTKTDKTYGAGNDPVYSYTYTDAWDGVGKLQFQLYDGETWKSEKEAVSTWTQAAKYNGKMFVHETSQWVAAPGETPASTGFYLTGDEAFVTGLGLDKSKAWNPDAKKVAKSDTTVLLKQGSYLMKITLDGKWETAQGYRNLTERASGIAAGSDDNISFTLTKDAYVTIIHSINEFKLESSAFDASQVTTLKDGYYLIGQNGWEVSNISETNMFVKDGEQYKLEANLAEGQSIKVVEVKNGAIEKWYPDGMGTEYTIDKAHAGKAPIYFQTEKKDEWKDFGGYFYIDTPSAPDPDPEYKGIFYITGDEALVTAMGLDKAKAWNPDAYKSDKDTAVLNLKAGDYLFKITLDGKWETAKGFSSLTEKAKGVTAGSDDNICFSLKEDGKVTVIYNGVIFKIIAAFDESKEPVLEDGYYLIGQTGWSIYNISAAGKFELFVDSTKEYKLDIMLSEGQTIKVVEVKDQAIIKWFPDGEGTEYKVDAAHAGAASIYFKATAQEDEAWKAFGGYMYIGASDNPIVDPAFTGVYYITGNEALVGSGKAWNPEAIKVEKDTFVMDLKAGDYEFKITLDGKWETAKGYSNLTERAKGIFADQNNNICFSFKEDGKLTVIYNGKIFKLEGAFDESKEIVVADGFYLIGQSGNWNISALTPALKFEKNGDSQDEYVLQTTLAEGQKIKVVKVAENTIKTWYPDGEGTEYTVDAAHAGSAKIYFKEAVQEDWKAFGGHIYIEASGAPDPGDQAIENTDVEMKAIKTIENGQLMIIMNGVKYTVTGAIVR